MANSHRYSTVALLLIGALLIIGAISEAAITEGNWSRDDVVGFMYPYNITDHVCIGITCNSTATLSVNGTTRTNNLYVNGKLTCLADGTNCAGGSGDNTSWNWLNATGSFYPLNSNPNGYYNTSTLPVSSNGINGTRWTLNTTFPSNPNVNDSFLNTSTHVYWQWTGSGWVQKGNLTGPKGAQGEPGPNGDPGPQGATGDPGQNGSNGTGIAAIYLLGNGSLQINRTDGVNTTSGNLTGPAGPQGIQGVQGEQGIQGIPGIGGTNGTNGSFVNGSDAIINNLSVNMINNASINTNSFGYFFDTWSTVTFNPLVMVETGAVAIINNWNGIDYNDSSFVTIFGDAIDFKEYDATGQVGRNTNFGVGQLEITDYANDWRTYVGDPGEFAITRPSDDYIFFDVSPSTFQWQGVNICLENGTNCPPGGGADGTGGWTNTSTITSTGLNVSVGGDLSTQGRVISNGTAAPLFIRRLPAGGYTSQQSVLNLLLSEVSGAACDNGCGPRVVLGEVNSSNDNTFAAGFGAYWINSTTGYRRAGLQFTVRANEADTFAATTVLTITNDSMVGIGTTTPTSTLSVNGNANITGTIYQNTKRVCLEDGTNCAAGGSSINRNLTIASQVRTSNVPTPILNLSMPVAANEYSKFECRIPWMGNTTTSGLALSLNITATTNNYWYDIVIPTSATAIIMGTSVNQNNKEVVGTASVQQNNLTAYIRGSINTSGAGSIIPRYRSEINGNNVTIWRGADCEKTVIA